MTTIELPVSPLPRPPPPHNQWGHYWPDYLRAYNTVLDAERHADEQVETNPSNREAKDDVMFSRLVGFLLLEFFDRRAILSERPCASLAKQIESVPRGGTSHEVVFEVGKWYWDRWICMYRKSLGEYPTPLRPLNLPLFDFDKLTLEDMTRSCMTADGKDYGTISDKVLARDGFRCMVTGSFDYVSTRLCDELDQRRRGIGASSTEVRACHILSKPATQDIDLTVASKEHAVTAETVCTADAVAVLGHFGLETLAQKLAADGVHHLGNLLSLAPNVYSHFDNLDLWFEGTDKPNHYTVCVFDGALARELRWYEQFHVDGDRTSSNPYHDNACPPNPQLLALHATCARAAKLSGAFDALVELERDPEYVDPPL